MSQRGAAVPERGAVGVVLDGQDGTATIGAVLPGSSADETGVNAGDVLVSIDGVRVTLSNASSLLSGSIGTVATALIWSMSQQRTFLAKLERRRVEASKEAVAVLSQLQTERQARSHKALQHMSEQVGGPPRQQNLQQRGRSPTRSRTSNLRSLSPSAVAIVADTAPVQPPSFVDTQSYNALHDELENLRINNAQLHFEVKSMRRSQSPHPNRDRYGVISDGGDNSAPGNSGEGGIGQQFELLKKRVTELEGTVETQRAQLDAMTTQRDDLLARLAANSDLIGENLKLRSLLRSQGSGQTHADQNHQQVLEDRMSPIATAAPAPTPAHGVDDGLYDDSTEEESDLRRLRLELDETRQDRDDLLQTVRALSSDLELELINGPGKNRGNSSQDNGHGPAGGSGDSGGFTAADVGREVGRWDVSELQGLGGPRDRDKNIGDVGDVGGGVASGSDGEPLLQVRAGDIEAQMRELAVVREQRDFLLSMHEKQQRLEIAQLQTQTQEPRFGAGSGRDIGWNMSDGLLGSFSGGPTPTRLEHEQRLAMSPLPYADTMQARFHNLPTNLATGEAGAGGEVFVSPRVTDGRHVSKYGEINVLGGGDGAAPRYTVQF